MLSVTHLCGFASASPNSDPYDGNFNPSTIDEIPAMTSNTAPLGKADQSAFYTIDDYRAWQAFNDMDNASCWCVISGSGWISYEFASPKIINKYTIKGPSATLGFSPKNWTFEGSNNPSDQTPVWTVLDTRSGISGYQPGEKKTFGFYNNVAYKAYRLNVTAANGNNDTLAISELEMIAVVLSSQYDGNVNLSMIDEVPTMTSNTTPFGKADQSSFYTISDYRAWQAFNDTDNASCWCTISGSGWISYEFLTQKIINKYTITGTAANPQFAPRNWTFEGSNNPSDPAPVWTVLDTRIGITGYQAGVKKIFGFYNGTAYKAYRLNISAANGNNDTLTISELEMIAAPPL